MSKLSNYLHAGKYQGLEGWLMDGAAWATFFVAQWQKENSIGGNVAEIGVHHGKYFILLSLLSENSELSAAIDVFDDQELNVDNSGKGDLAAFLANFGAFDGREAKLLVHKIDSLKLSGRDIARPNCPRAKGDVKSFRIFSVDGSHTAEHTANDIEFAFEVLAPRGIVVVDDFYNAHWPGVQEGVHRLLARRPDICAVAYGENKLFLARPQDHADYLDLFKNVMSEFYSDMKVVELHGKAAVCFSMGDPRPMLDADMVRRKWVDSFGARGERTVELIDGWANREATGAWITQPVARAKVRLPSSLCEGNAAVAISVDVYPYVNDRRHRRKVRIASGLGQVFEREIDQGATFTFEVGQPSQNREIALEFSAEAPDVPAEISPANSDTRALSLFVSKIGFSSM